MTEFINRTTASLTFWWTAWVEGTILLSLSGLNAWIGATGNITTDQWINLSSWDRSKIYNPIIVALLVVLRGFMSNTMAQLQNKQANTGNMQTMKTIQNILLVLALLFTFGCATQVSRPTLKLSPYGGDPFLYRTDQILCTSYGELEEFVKWERNFRPLINDPAASVKANEIRINSKKWIVNAIKLRDAYAKIPDANVQDDLLTQLNVITTAINESFVFMSRHPITINSPP